MISNLSINCAWCYVSRRRRESKEPFVNMLSLMKVMLLYTYKYIHKEESNIMQMVCEAHSIKEYNGVICFLRHRLQCGGCLQDGTSCSQISDTLATSSSVEAEKYRSIICFFLLPVINRGCSLSQHAVGGRQEHIWLIANPSQGFRNTQILISVQSSVHHRAVRRTQRILFLVLDLLLNCPLIVRPLIDMYMIYI